MDLQNKNNIWVAKQVSYRILVPMSYISFLVQEGPAGAFWADKIGIWGQQVDAQGRFGSTKL